MDHQHALIIGSERSQYLKIAPMYRNYPDSDDFSDANWITADIKAAAGGFRGHVQAYLTTMDFVDFRQSLSGLEPEGTAVFETIEEWLEIKVMGDGLGHFVARCRLVDDPGIGNELTFALSFDQTELPRMLKELDGIIKAFPVLNAERLRE